jgi:succinate-acetate transporter protein
LYDGHTLDVRFLRKQNSPPNNNGDSRTAQAGDAATAEAPTTTPYARAMHMREASYCAWPLWLHVLLAHSVTAAKNIFWLLPILAVLYFTLGDIEPRDMATPVRDGVTFGIMCAVAVGVYTLAVICALGTEIITK